MIRLMANLPRPKRNPDKKFFGAYVWEKDLRKIRQIASDNGITQADMLKGMIKALDDNSDEAISKILECAKKETPATVAG